MKKSKKPKKKSSNVTKVVQEEPIQKEDENEAENDGWTSDQVPADGPIPDQYRSKVSILEDQVLALKADRAQDRSINERIAQEQQQEIAKLRDELATVSGDVRGKMYVTHKKTFLYEREITRRAQERETQAVARADAETAARVAAEERVGIAQQELEDMRQMQEMTEADMTDVSTTDDYGTLKEQLFDRDNAIENLKLKFETELKEKDGEIEIANRRVHEVQAIMNDQVKENGRKIETADRRADELQALLNDQLKEKDSKIETANRRVNEVETILNDRFSDLTTLLPPTSELAPNDTNTDKPPTWAMVHTLQKTADHERMLFSLSRARNQAQFVNVLQKNRELIESREALQREVQGLKDVIKEVEKLKT
jgi:hypothetical protein